MNYIGSKQRLLDFIESNIRSVVPEIKSTQFCDLFAGTATVSRHFNGKVKSLISNDVEEYAHILGAYSLQNCVLSKLDPMIDILNQLPGQKDYFIITTHSVDRDQDNIFRMKTLKKSTPFGYKSKNGRIQGQLVKRNELHYWQSP